MSPLSVYSRALIYRVTGLGSSLMIVIDDKLFILLTLVNHAIKPFIVMSTLSSTLSRSLPPKLTIRWTGLMRWISLPNSRRWRGLLTFAPPIPKKLTWGSFSILNTSDDDRLVPTNWWNLRTWELPIQSVVIMLTFGHVISCLHCVNLLHSPVCWIWKQVRLSLKLYNHRKCYMNRQMLFTGNSRVTLTSRYRSRICVCTKHYDYGRTIEAQMWNWKLQWPSWIITLIYNQFVSSGHMSSLLQGYWIWYQLKLTKHRKNTLRLAPISFTE